MPTGPRIRANNVYGVISDNPLTAASPTFNSVSLPLLPPVIAAHAVAVFDPKRVYGDPEIVVVTAHTAASTVATILRGQYGTSPREHPQGTAWAHVPVDEDWTEILTSSTRPGDPYRGQMIFETDTDKFVARSVLDVWQDVVPLGAWQSYTPTLTNVTVGAATQAGRFTRVGRIIFVQWRFIFGAGTAITGDVNVSLPTTANSAFDTIGSAVFMDATGGTSSNQRLQGGVRFTSATLFELVHGISNTSGNAGIVNPTNPFTWAINDQIYVNFTYEAAS